RLRGVEGLEARARVGKAYDVVWNRQRGARGKLRVRVRKAVLFRDYIPEARIAVDACSNGPERIARLNDDLRRRAGRIMRRYRRVVDVEVGLERAVSALKLTKTPDSIAVRVEEVLRLGYVIGSDPDVASDRPVPGVIQAHVVAHAIEVPF